MSHALSYAVMLTEHNIVCESYAFNTAFKNILCLDLGSRCSDIIMIMQVLYYAIVMCHSIISTHPSPQDPL